MILDILTALGPVWTWVLIGLILMGAELAISGVFLVWLGIAAMVTGLETALVPMPWQAQILFFAGLSVGLVVLAQKRMAGHPNSLNRGAQGLIGQEFHLDAAIANGLGRIRVNDTLWRVSGPDAPAGTRIRVTGIEGTTLTVTTA
ncbi:NfeD family protein [Methylobacterium sp. W2]|uniref:NfeD family protein n=1 Tax=Methylobacterium sp. W2 TaxID=2598107 RepID=UPI001D0CCB1E|nr:NfeD family protein [Methylobacterium sp. W2]MCC0807178.1 NfeD family protein [Methylobacterium sp. W2]